MHLPVTSDSQGNAQMTEELSKDLFLQHFVSSQGKLQKHGLSGDSKTYRCWITAGHIHRLQNLFVVTSLQLQCDIFHSTYGPRCQSEFQAIL